MAEPVATVKTAGLGSLVTVSTIVPPLSVRAAVDAASSGLADLAGGDGVGEAQGAGAGAAGVARCRRAAVVFRASFGVPVTFTAALKPTVMVITEPTP